MAKRSSSSNGKITKKSRTSTSQAQPPSFLTKLEQLRSFVPETWSERDLSTCLRESNHDVHLAAEHILTGQFKATPTKSNQVIGEDDDVLIVTPPGSKSPKTPKSKTLKKEVFNASDSPLHSFLLAKRWISNACCTCRRGVLEHNQPLEISVSPTGPPVARFANEPRTCQGTLPPHLGAMLAPLLRNNPPLIYIQGRAIMGDSNLYIGCEVPLELTLFLCESFFQAFDFAASNQTESHAWKAPTTSRKSWKRATPIAVAAFDLLQWAHYGDAMPEFPKPDDDEDDDEKDDQAKVLNEEDFLPQQDDDDNKNNTSQLESLVSNDSSELYLHLPEAPDPEGLQVHITLRSYQRQALYWMTQREQPNCATDEMELLLELAKQQHESLSNKTSRIDLILEHAEEGTLMCDCGPVKLSQELADHAATLHDKSIINPQIHPLWSKRYVLDLNVNEPKIFYINELFRWATAKPPPPPQPCRGGILADSMGLGKTVMLLSLVAQKTCQGVTLVVTPLSLLTQWSEELVDKTSNLKHIVYYGDSSKRSSINFEGVDVVLTTFGTLQGEYLARNRRDAYTPLMQMHWARIILDEAHGIKNTDTAISKACCLLNADRKWCVTGTPIQNSLKDVYGLIKFLKHEPWCDASFWKRMITNCGTDEDGFRVALGRVKRLLAPMMIRRTKQSLDKHGNPILILPPVENKVITVQFSDAERKFYNALLDRSLTVFEGFIQRGTASKSWLAIFSLLQRLRQACDHVALTVKTSLDESEAASDNVFTKVKSKQHIQRNIASEDSANDSRLNEVKEAVNDEFLQDLLKKFGTSQDDTVQCDPYISQVAADLCECVQANGQLTQECPVCLECPQLGTAVLTLCGHMFCKECLIGTLKEVSKVSHKLSLMRGPCPVCNKVVQASRIIVLSRNAETKQATTQFLAETTKPVSYNDKVESQNQVARQTLEAGLKGAWNSAKLQAVMDELSNVWESDPGSKVVMFSQFLGCLDLLELSFSEQNIVHARLDGKLNMPQRVKVLEDFKTRKGSSVLLVSMKAGGVGINLVSASTVFIIDPWWNAAIEDQCINRIHRIGQKANVVRVRKFIVQNSVEEKMVKLQLKKQDMATEILNDNGAGVTTMPDTSPTLEDFKELFQR